MKKNINARTLHLEFTDGDFKYISGKIIDHGGRPCRMWMRYRMVAGVWVFVDKDIFSSAAGEQKIIRDFNTDFDTPPMPITCYKITVLSV